MNLKHTILFRDYPEFAEEIEVAKKYFQVIHLRTHLPYNQVVIPRYMYGDMRELFLDIKWCQCCGINSYRQYKWVESFEYYETLKDVTFETWDDSNFYRAPEGEYIVKGRNKSKKEFFNKFMYVRNKLEAVKIANLLMTDSFILEQGIIYRKYTPLKTFEIGINGLPFSNEWRFFFYKEKLLCYGYYWIQAEDALSQEISQRGLDFARQVAKMVSGNATFYSMDTAELAGEPDRWVLVELNSGEQSGLSLCDPHELYSNLRNTLDEEIA